MIVRGKMIIILSLLLPMIALFPLAPVFADVPDVQEIVYWTDGVGNTVLNITIRHNANVPPLSHYVDWIDMEIDGSTTTVPLLNNQTTQIFVAQYNMGQVIDTPTLRARVHCIVHFYGGFSAPLQIPEFSVIQLLGIFVLVSIVSLFLSRKNILQKRLNPRNSKVHS